MRSRRKSRSTVRKAGLLGLLACVTIAMTAWAAGAQSEPDRKVREATEAAERAAATETALRKVDRAGGSEGPASATALSTIGRDFQPEKLSVVPDDWQKAGLDIDKADRIGDRLVQQLPGGLQVELTIDPALQSHLENVLDDYAVPHGSVVLVGPETGRVLAMVNRTDHEPEMPALARHAAAPAASTFKIVTAAALIESAGVDPQSTTCYHGGTRRLTKSNILGSSHDNKCENLGDALGWSINSIFAKLSYKHFDRNDLRVWAERFGYNTEIPFELPVEQSTAEIVEDPLERARTAAGFWHTYLSPLHGALIGAAVQNGGLMMQPSIIEKVRTADGGVLESFEPTVMRRVMSTETADILGELLETTTQKGTADKYFAHRNAFPNDVRAAGKTGTLSNDDPYLSFTWFVGFGEHQQVSDRAAAVGGLICNTPKWRIKGPWAASEGLRKYFQVQQRRARATSDEKLAASEQ